MFCERVETAAVAHQPLVPVLADMITRRISWSWNPELPCPVKLGLGPALGGEQTVRPPGGQRARGPGPYR
jgi:hypothetical protein